ncbi:hypothetical protein EVAR_98491_1 [Eumeta japonica]|uniref:Uncharacterized protein n=1 Tax=Eumeta variegata TaxID=151549 RepID=A0A4C1YHZ4_EUMVA|nr:hypothetical protein EVAR_98491_1 [Eumeta japonica]
MTIELKGSPVLISPPLRAFIRLFRMYASRRPVRGILRARAVSLSERATRSSASAGDRVRGAAPRVAGADEKYIAVIPGASRAVDGLPVIKKEMSSDKRE